MFIGESYCFYCAAAGLLNHCCPRKYADAGVYLDCSLDCLDVIEFHYRTDSYIVTLQDAVYPYPCGDVFLKADKSFNTILDHNDNLFIEQAEWCLGFCYLMTEDMAAARKQFYNITISNSSYKEDALNILKKMK